MKHEDSINIDDRSLANSDEPKSKSKSYTLRYDLCSYLQHVSACLRAFHRPRSWYSNDRKFEIHHEHVVRPIDQGTASLAINLGSHQNMSMCNRITLCYNGGPQWVQPSAFLPMPTVHEKEKLDHPGGSVAKNFMNE